MASTQAQLAGISSFPAERYATIMQVAQKYPMQVTNYYLNLIKEVDDPIYKQCIPAEEELTDSTGQADPLQEENYSPVPRLHHRYPDRVLLLVTNNCAMFCRFCTRKRNIRERTKIITDRELAEAVNYISNHKEIRDVLVSGGDPLTLPIKYLDKIIHAIRRVPHVEIVRIGTRIPCVDPERVSEELCAMLKKHHPLYINVHFNNPAEITPQSKRACAMLADAGIQLGNQSVLLKGVNDQPEVMKELVGKLLTMRVKPYYLFLPDMVQGTHHFRTSLETGLKIMDAIHGWMSGMATPQLVIDIENGGGKVALLPEYIIDKSEQRYTFRNFEGKLFEYTDI